MKTNNNTDNDVYSLTMVDHSIDFSTPRICRLTSARPHKNNPKWLEVFAADEETGTLVYMAFPRGTFKWATTALRQLVKSIDPKLPHDTVIHDVCDFLNGKRGARFSVLLTPAKGSTTMVNAKLHTISKVTE